MLDTLKNIFGFGEATDFNQLIKEGAMIIDVRTPGEYSGGHIRGSVNIPLDQLSKQLGKLKKKDQAIITCCASGMRSSSAKNLLQSNGYTQVYNGGGWTSLQNKL